MNAALLISLVSSALYLAGFQLAGAGPSLTAQPGSLDALEEQTVSALFYADSSCLLSIDELSASGLTLIDAKVDAQGSRMMIHCDMAGGKRLTLLANGNSLGSRERVALLTAAEMDAGEDGMVAWLSDTHTEIGDADAPRRFLSGGRVLIRETPVANVAGSALQSGQQFFASVKGTLEPALEPTDGGLPEDNEESMMSTTPAQVQPTASDTSTH